MFGETIDPTMDKNPIDWSQAMTILVLPVGL